MLSPLTGIAFPTPFFSLGINLFMSSHLPAHAIVAQRLGDELALLERFRAMLSDEQALLQAGDADALPPLTTQKNSLAEQLALTMQQREQALVQLGLQQGRAGMEAWLASFPETSRLSHQARWQKLLSLADECRNEHELNGKLLAMRLAQNQQALTALLSAGGKPLTYGPDGQQRLGIGSGRTLGSA